MGKCEDSSSTAGGFHLFLRRQSEDDASKLASSERAREGQIPRPSGANLAKEPKGSFRETRSCPVAL